ncbi:UPF0524 protein C3orf70 homolog [Centroberyx gerrardi]
MWKNRRTTSIPVPGSVSSFGDQQLSGEPSGESLDVVAVVHGHRTFPPVSILLDEADYRRYRHSVADRDGMASPRALKSVKRDEAQSSARSCAGRPDFLPCDGGQSACATHSHGKCFKLHWCCHLGWCHCKYLYQPMTSVFNLPSTSVPSSPSEYSPSFSLSVSLAERFLRSASSMVAPATPPTPKLCIIAELFMDDYVVKRINGKMCYVQRLPLTPPPKTQAIPAKPLSMLSSPESGHPTPIHQSHLYPQPSNQNPPQTRKPYPPKLDQRLVGQKSQPCSSPSSSEDSGINAVGGAYTESYDEEEEGEEEEEEEEEEEVEEESRSDVESSHGSYWKQEDFSLLAPSRSLVEIIEKIETTV